jgi:cyclopentanol dehydrogenase
VQTWEGATLADFKRILDVNLDSQFLGIQAVVPHMTTNGGGSIVNISSVCGLVAFPNTHPGYSASKAAIRLLTKTAAVDYASRKIRVNSVHPGLIETAMTKNIVNEPAILARIPFGRAAQPEEVGKAVLFLASDDASYISGIELVIDGAQTSI